MRSASGPNLRISSTQFTSKFRFNYDFKDEIDHDFTAPTSSVNLVSHSLRSISHFFQLFMGTAAMVFAPLAPLVAVAAAVVFWVSSWVYKYQLMFVFVSRVETGGVSVDVSQQFRC